MERLKLGDICDILNGYAFKSSKYVDHGVRIIRITNVQKGLIIDEDPKFYPEESLPAINKYILEKDDLLISLTGNVGRVGLLTEDLLPAALNQRVACLRLKSPKMLKQFLFLLLDSDYFEIQCIHASKGIAQKNLSTEWLKDFPIPMYSLEKQSEIIEKLGIINRLIFLSQKAYNQLNLLIKSRFVEMFGTALDAISNAQNIISDVAKVQVGIVIKPTRFYAVGREGVKAFRSLNVLPFHVNEDSDWVYFSKSGMEQSKRTIVHENDILVVRSGNPGTACVVSKDYDGCNVIDLIIVHPDKSKILPQYLCAYLNFDHGMIQINGQSHGVAQKHFNVSMCENLKVLVPSLQKQNEFVDFLDQVDKSKLAVQKSLDELEILKKSLLQQYFG